MLTASYSYKHHDEQYTILLWEQVVLVPELHATTIYMYPKDFSDMFVNLMGDISNLMCQSTSDMSDVVCQLVQ